MSLKVRSYCLILICGFVYSLVALATKAASMEPFLSILFFAFYGASLLGLMVYALLWQQAIRHLPLSTAFCLKSLTVIWAILWGYLFYSEMLTVWKFIGAAMIIAGSYFVAASDMSTEADSEALT